MYEAARNQTKIVTVRHPPATTHVIDCGSGESIVDFQANTSNQRFELVSSRGNPAHLKVTMAGHVPAINFAPTIDISGDFTIDFIARRVHFKGEVDRYPAYEAYFRFDQKEWQTLFTRMPADGTTALDLYPPTVGIDIEVADQDRVPNPPSNVTVQ